MRIYVSVSARTQQWFDGLTKTAQKEYLQKHPNSKFGKKAVKAKPVKAKPAKAVKTKRVADPLLDEYNYNVEWAEKELAKAKAKGFPSAISAAKALLANATRKRTAYLKRKTRKL